MIQLGSLLYVSTQYHWSPLFAKQISLSLSQLVSVIIGPKVGITFQQNLQKMPFGRFEALIFDPILPSFSLLLGLLDSILTKP